MENELIEIQENLNVKSDFELNTSRDYDTFWKRLKSFTSRERRLWNLLIFIITLYNAIVIPMKLCFQDTWYVQERTASLILFILDYVGDLFLWMDIVLRFV